MKNKMKKTLLLSLAVILAVLVSTTVVQAIGTLTPSGTAGDDTQYSLNDIYTKLTTGADGTEGSGTMSVPGTQTASFYTLTEIYNALPDWLTLSDSTTTVSEGFYEATDLTTVDTDLVAENIADGVEVFGVTGTLEVATELEWSTGQGSMNWATAVSTCAALTEGEAEAGDWHLPTISELSQGILYDWIEEGDLEGDTFGDGASTGYWSSSENNVNFSWSARWVDDLESPKRAKNSSYYVICVR
jgi:hypothetical protein